MWAKRQTPLFSEGFGKKTLLLHIVRRRKDMSAQTPDGILPDAMPEPDGWRVG